METTSYYAVRGDAPTDAIKSLNNRRKEDLVGLLFNDHLNRFVADYADIKQDAEDKHGYAKRIPYIGWFWRATDWFTPSISIGDCGDFIGVMENNKWGYPERFLTKDEAAKVLAIVWEAKNLSEKGGSLDQIKKETFSKLDELWPLFQTFKI